MPKPSYLERSLRSFIKEKFAGGFKILFEKPILPFSAFALSLLLFSRILNTIWIGTDDPVQLTIINDLMNAGLLIAVSYVVFGLIAGIWKNEKFQVSLNAIGIACAFLLVYVFNLEAVRDIFPVLKLVFFLIWTVITAFSVLFMLIYLFSSISGKLLTYGQSSDHIFMGALLNLVNLGNAGLAIYMVILNQTADAIVLCVLVLAASGLYFFFWALGEHNASSTNFMVIMGFFNFYVSYNLVSSVMPSEGLTDTITDIIILTISTLYIVQNMGSRISHIKIKQLDKIEKKRRVFFQRRVNLFPWIKKHLGTFTLVLMALGLSYGYLLALTAYYNDPAAEIFPNLLDNTMGIRVVIHRISLFIAVVVFIVAFVFYFLSDTFREMVTNKYSAKQAIRIAGDVVMSWGRRIRGVFRGGKSKKKKKKDKEEEEEEEEEDLADLMAAEENH